MRFTTFLGTPNTILMLFKKKYRTAGNKEKLMEEVERKNKDYGEKNYDPERIGQSREEITRDGEEDPRV